MLSWQDYSDKRNLNHRLELIIRQWMRAAGDECENIACLCDLLAAGMRRIVHCAAVARHLLTAGHLLLIQLSE
jgi:hypothetical protein